MMRRPQTLAQYRIRAISGAMFGLCGIIVAVELAIKPAPGNAKLIAFALPVVMVALAVVRIRDYFRARAASQ
jgi:FAD/FMN-containing dehydrogenase